MNVKDLIKALKKLPPNAIVIRDVNNPEEGMQFITVSGVMSFFVATTEQYDGVEYAVTADGRRRDSYKAVYLH